MSPTLGREDVSRFMDITTHLDHSATREQSFQASTNQHGPAALNRDTLVTVSHW